MAISVGKRTVSHVQLTQADAPKHRNMRTNEFYDRLTPFYHLLYPDWEAAVERQAACLDRIIRRRWGAADRTILDVSCGIGTQALGLASLGCDVTGSDISEHEVERARSEAAKRGVNVRLSVADMREAVTHHARRFHVVISCDNSVPHLLSDAEILRVFEQFHACTLPGGGCLISVRDYDADERSGTTLKPYGVRDENGTRFIAFQVWDFDGAIYDLTLYLITDRGDSDCDVHLLRTKYYAVGTDTLVDLLQQAGFVDVQRLDHQFFQPLIVGTKE